MGDEYIEALWAANPRVPKSADFVMHWWDRAADILTRPGTRLKRFGLVTTNSITQVFSRRVIEGWLAAGEGDANPPRSRGGGSRIAADGGGPEEKAAAALPPPPPAQAPVVPLPASGEDLSGKLHLTLAIPDHPWTRVTRDAAAVRIAMTVAAAGPGEGRLVRITGERAIDTDAPELDAAETIGVINADLTIGANVTRVVPLKANDGLSSNGMLLAGRGFVLSRAEADRLIVADGSQARAAVKSYRGGSELVRGSQDRYIIDLFGLDEQAVRKQVPAIYQHLLTPVYKARQQVAQRSSSLDARDYLARWWQFAKQRAALRQAVDGLQRYIATTETTKHRLFQFVPGNLIPDHMIIAIASDDAFHLGVLSSRFHTEWALEKGGTLEDRPRYNKTVCLNPFPFPDTDEPLRERVRVIAEELDQTRFDITAAIPSLTMTGLYNLVEDVRSGVLLTPQREAEVVRARARIVAKLHDDLDQAVADAYGWGEEWRRAPLPPAEIVARLVRLNAERAREEAAGHIRWLRPEYQKPRFGP